MNKKKYLFLCLFCSVLLFFSSCNSTGQASASCKYTGYTMGSLVQQEIFAAEAQAQEAFSDVTSALAQLENKISWRIAASEISRLNAAAGKSACTLSEDVCDLIILAKQIAEESDGAFEPTILPISSLWQFDEEVFPLPNAEEIAQKLSLVDYRDILLSEENFSVLLAKEGQSIDLGGLGKGAACNAALKIYSHAGIPAASISVGGSIGFWGVKPDGSPWRVGIRDPNGGQNELLGVLSLTEGCVSTSGTYEKGATVNGVYYHHLIDSHTGYPARCDLISATVVHKNGAISDALATACVILGKEKSLPLLEKYHAQAVFVDNNRHIYLTDDLISSFELTNKGYSLGD